MFNLEIKIGDFVRTLKQLKPIVKWPFRSPFRSLVLGIIGGIFIMTLFHTDRASLWLMIRSSIFDGSEFDQEKMKILVEKLESLRKELEETEKEENKYRIKAIAAKIEKEKKAGIPVQELAERMRQEKCRYYWLRGQPIPKELQQEPETSLDFEEVQECKLILLQSDKFSPLEYLRLRPNKKDALSINLFLKEMIIKQTCRKGMFPRVWDFQKGRTKEKWIDEEPKIFTLSDILIRARFKFIGAYFMPYSVGYIPSGDFVMRNFRALDSEPGWYKVDIPTLNKGNLLIGGIFIDTLPSFLKQSVYRKLSFFLTLPESTIVSLDKLLNDRNFPGTVPLSCLRDRYNIPLETLMDDIGILSRIAFSEKTTVLGIKSTQAGIAEFISCQ